MTDRTIEEGAVLLVVDDTAVARGLAPMMTRSTRKCVVVHGVGSAKRALARKTYRWCGFLISTQLGDASGFDVVEAIAARYARSLTPPTLLMNEGRENASAMINDAYRRGCSVIGKPILVSDLRRFFADADAFDTGLAPPLAKALREFADAHRLTPAETALLSLVLAHEPRSRVLAARNITSNTYKAHVRSILRKTGLKSLEWACHSLMRGSGKASFRPSAAQ